MGGVLDPWSVGVGAGQVRGGGGDRWRVAAAVVLALGMSKW